MNILSVDIGTTSMKMGVYQEEQGTLLLIRQFSQEYSINTYNDGLFSDIEPQKWQEAFLAGCKGFSDLVADIDVIALSGTTPGLTAMDKDGEPVYPAILMLDQRSTVQAQNIIDAIGLDELLGYTANMPVAGGCSLASMLWIKEQHPDIFKRVSTFGHSNTFFCKWLTGTFAIDPSSASLMALYNTVANDMTWNRSIAGEFDISIDSLPELYQAHESPGRVLPQIASKTGLTKQPPVVIGGNDAVLAAYSVQVENSGEIFNINGTCEITMVCLPRCIPSQNYNIRAHVIPDRWVTLYVMNAGGKAFEWFRGLFCSEMDNDFFFNDFVPRSIDTWLDRESGVTYTPYLMGSRYTNELLKAEFLGLTPETSREELLTAMVKGLCQYQRAHLNEISGEIELSDAIVVSGGAITDSYIRAKNKWMWTSNYGFETESSLKGAAMLGRKYLKKG